MLAIATPNPDSIAETFVRQHIRLIAPGRTSVLYFHGEGESISDLPSMKLGDSNFQLGKSLMLRAWNFLARGYSGSITGSEMERLSTFLTEHNVHTLFAEFGPTGCALRHLCKASGLKLFVNFHGHDATAMAREWRTRWGYRRLARHADGFICGSKFFAGVLKSLGFPEEKTHVVPCGIEIEEFQSSCEKDPNLILGVGRFVEKKAPHLAIESFRQVAAQIPAARLEMIGGGPLLQSCKALVNKLGIDSSVVFHDAQSHSFVKQKLAQASVFIQHSVRASNGDMESQGISLLEAMAATVPVVATRHNGFVETVLDGETGFLVDEFDVSSMAEKTVTLLRDAGLRAAFGRKARGRVKDKFDSEVVAEQLRTVLGL